MCRNVSSNNNNNNNNSSAMVTAAFLVLCAVATVLVSADDYTVAESHKSLLVAVGCFWCGEQAFEQYAPGVVEAVSGYAGGTNDNPSTCVCACVRACVLTYTLCVHLCVALRCGMEWNARGDHRDTNPYVPHPMAGALESRSKRRPCLFVCLLVCFCSCRLTSFTSIERCHFY